MKLFMAFSNFHYEYMYTYVFAAFSAELYNQCVLSNEFHSKYTNQLSKAFINQ